MLKKFKLVQRAAWDYSTRLELVMAGPASTVAGIKGYGLQFSAAGLRRRVEVSTIALGSLLSEMPHLFQGRVAEGSGLRASRGARRLMEELRPPIVLKAHRRGRAKGSVASKGGRLLLEATKHINSWNFLLALEP